MFIKLMWMTLLSFLVINLEVFGSYEEPKICLTMIVKNESKIIKRCLDNVKGIVDCIVICDTGSSDNTVEIIEEFLSTHQIPGKIYHHPWVDFGYNRSLSADAATEYLQEQNFSLFDTYLLFLDADMMLKVTPDFDKSQLQEDSYLLIQKSRSLWYYNMRLGRAALPWVSVGPTHEYWLCRKKATSGKLDTLWIDDKEDGGSKANKFERDIKFLTQGLEKEPYNTRYMFYLAESYRSSKQYDLALHWYLTRIAFNGWKEEVWFSKFMIGEIYNSMGHWDQALHYYLAAYQYLPTRSESLEKIALHYRVDQEYNIAYIFAAHGLKIPFPADQLLFISMPVYNYRFDEEISISAYYTPFRSEGLEAITRLLNKEDIPASVRAQAERNLLFYID